MQITHNGMFYFFFMFCKILQTDILCTDSQPLGTDPQPLGFLCHRYPSVYSTYHIYSVIRCFSFQNNPKNLDLSYKIDLDFGEFLAEKTPSYNS